MSPQDFVNMQEWNLLVMTTQMLTHRLIEHLQALLPDEPHVNLKTRLHVRDGFVGYYDGDYYTPQEFRKLTDDVRAVSLCLAIGTLECEAVVGDGFDWAAHAECIGLVV